MLKAQIRLSKGRYETQSVKTGSPENVLSLGKRLLVLSIKNNTSRMTGDRHVRFCERREGEIPSRLLSALSVAFTVKSMVDRKNETKTLTQRSQSTQR